MTPGGILTGTNVNVEFPVKAYHDNSQLNNLIIYSTFTVTEPLEPVLP